MSRSVSAPSPGVPSWRRRTVLLVVLSLILGLVGTTGVTTGQGPEAAAAPPGNLVGRWALDNGSGTTATDSTGFKAATLTSGASWAGGVQGTSSLVTNGTTGAAVTSGSVVNTASSFTVSAYAKPNSLGGIQTVVSQDGTQISGFFLQLRGDVFGVSKLSADTSSSATAVAVAGTTAVVGQWYHLVVVYNSTANTLAFYQNGRLQQTVTSSSRWNATGNLAIGRAKYNGANTDWFNGGIDDVRAYSRALTASEVSHVSENGHWAFDEGTGTTAADESQNGYTGALTNGPTWGPGPVGDSAVELDGSNDFVDVNHSVLDTSKSFSVSAWTRTTQITTPRVIASVDGTNYSGFTLSISSTGKWAFARASSDVGAPTLTSVLSTTTATVGTWYHVVGVYDSGGNTLALYVDGVKQGASVSYATGWKATGDFIIGRSKANAAPAAYFSGAIDDVRAFPFAIESSMVTDLANPTPPPVPATPTATATGTTVTVNWVAPAPISGSPTTGYVVTPYVNGVAGTPQTFGTATTQNFTGTLGSSYRYTVAAINANGTSAPSAQSNAVTPATAPSAPAAPTATAGSVSASVSWTAPAANGSAITGYVVTPYVGATAGTAQTFNSTATTQTVTGLTAGTAYTFRVAAKNAVGTGVQSPASNAVTPNANPSIVVATPTAGQVGAAYSFTFTRTGGTTPFTWSVSAGTLPGGLTLAPSTGVLSGTPTTAGSYPFTVKITDTSGATDTEAVTLLIIDKPATPAAPTATAGLTSAVISWVAPASNGSPITAYVITPYKGGVAQPTITVDPAAKTRTIDGLTAGSIYSFAIAATNAAGTSAASGVSNPVTPYAALNEPTITTVTPGSSSARLTWTAPSSLGGSAITGYLVTPYIGTTAQPAQTFAGTATTQTVTGLTPGTAYTFRVAATNNSGRTWLYRNNVAGPQLASLDEGLVWAADTAGATRLNFSNTSTWPGPIVVDGTVPGTTPTELFLTQRWEPGLRGDGAEGKLSYPVTTGVPVKVRLYFYNGNSGFAPGQRVFDVNLEGAPVLDAFDPVTGAGGNQRGTMREFAITSDGSVDIDFLHDPNDPTLSGIEIIQTGVALTGPQSAASASSTPNANPTLTFAAPPAASMGVAYSQQLAVNNGTAPFTWSVSTGTLPAGITFSSGGLLSGTPTALGTNNFTVQVLDGSGQTATRAVSLLVNDKPATPAAPTATAGLSNASVTWTAPASNGSAITGYLVTPYKGGVAQTPVSFDASTTTRTLTGLTPGAAYAFTVSAINAVGTSTASPLSNLVVPYAVPAAPVITTATAANSAVNLAWTAPSANGSPITGYLVTPYIGGAAQATQSFSGSTTAAVITGLTPGTAYTFTVTAVNAIGPGPASVASAAVTPNASPTLNFPAPPVGEVNVTYSRQLTVTDGTAPYTWSVATGTLPAGLTLSAGGLLSGTPTTAGTSNFTVQVSDAGGQTATKAVSLAVNPQPTVTFTPTAGQVNVAYHHQPTVAGGVGPFAWAISAGSLPAGVSISSTTGLISGTPTASGSFGVTVRATDAYGQAATQAGTITIAAVPTLTSAPPATRAGINSSFTFAATGGTGLFTYAVVAGSLPTGMTLTSAGVFSGTPRVIGTYAFTVRATDANGQTANKAVTYVVDQAPIQVVKTANVSSVAPGDSVTFTVTATNVSTTYYGNTHLYDPLAGVLDDATYSGNATVTTGSVGYSGGTLDWAIPLDGGATATMTYTVVVANPDTGNKVLSGVIQGQFAATSCAPGYEAAGCSVAVSVSGLTIVKTASSATTTPGGTVTFTTVVTNSGQTAYAGAAFSDNLGGNGVLDDATYNGNASATLGSVSYAGSTVSWTGNLAVGTSATITYSVTVIDRDTGNRSLASTIVSATAGSTCPSGNPTASCTATVTVLVPALVITNTADVSTTTPGSKVTYTVTLANTGQTAYSGISVDTSYGGMVDDATYNNDATATTGSVVVDPVVGAFVWTGSIPVGGTVTITASVTVLDPDPGNKMLTSVASSAAAGNTCPVGSSNSACKSNVPVLIPALTLSTSTNVNTTTPGSAVTYTVLATNTGQTPYVDASFAQNLAGVLDDAIYNNDATASLGSATYAGSTVSWTGDLAVGASATITFSVTVDNPDAGTKSLTSTLVSTTKGSNCASGSGDTRCASTVTVLVPALTLGVVADVATTTPGSVVRYTTSVANTGQTTYTGVQIALDSLGTVDDASGNGDTAVSQGSLEVNPNGAAIWTLTLAPGESATASGTWTVQTPPMGNRVMATEVSANVAGSSCPPGSPNASCSVAVPVLIPGLTITKTANTSAVVTGGSVSYTITATNTGETTLADAAFTDSLANLLFDATYAGGATATSGTVSYAAPTLSWNGSLAPGAAVTVTYEVTVRDPDPGDKTMTNTVVSSTSGSNCAPTSTDPRCTAIVSVLVPQLSIVKTASATTTTPGATVGYLITVTNSGDTAYPAANFADRLAGVQDDATYNNDAAATAGSASVTSDILGWSGALAVGASATITYSFTVHAADGGDNLLTNTVTSTSAGNNCPSGGIDARCAVTVPVARLVISQGYESPTTTPGSLLRLNASFTNTGQVPYTGITISSPSADTVDDATVTGDQTATSGSLVLSATAITWTGSIPVGGVVSVTGTLTVQNPDLGNNIITGTLVSNAPGNNCPSGGSDPRCTALITVLLPALSISKTSSTTQVEPGGSIGYTITVTNTGQTAYNSAVVTDDMSGALDSATYNANAVATVGTLAYGSPTLTWTGNLAVGASATITYSMTSLTSTSGDKDVRNRVSSTEVGSNCPPASPRTACVSSVTVLTPALTLTKSADQTNPTLGATVTYTVLVANTGQTTYPAATFTDPLAGVLDDASYDAGATTASRGTPSYADGVLSWTGALSPGDTATITYTVTVSSPSTGDRNMTNTVTSPSAGSSCPAGSPDTSCSVTVSVTNAVTLTFAKTASAAKTVPDGVLTYTVTVTNSSASAIIGVDFTDALAGTLDDAAFNNDAVASAGTVGFTSSNLTWTGTVPAGATVTVTYSVTTSSTETGNDILTSVISSGSVSNSNNCLAGSADTRCSATVPVARLDLHQYAAEATTTPGSVVHLTQVYVNTGQSPYFGITVVSPRADTSDDTLATGDQVASSGTFVGTPTEMAWTGDIPVGGTVTITRTLIVKDPNPGNQLIRATLRSDAAGSNCPVETSDPRCSFSITVLTPGLSISKTANVPYATPGAVVGYTITVRNTGQTAYVGAALSDSLAGLLDDATYAGGATASSGTLSYASPTLSWTGDLAVGQIATISYSATVKSPETGDKVIGNRVVSTTVGSTCPPASSNAGCAVTVPVLTPALTLTAATSQASAVPGDTLTYTLVANNTGQTAFPSATFSAPLADITDDATVNANATATVGSVSLTGSSLTWTGALAPGESTAVSYTVTVLEPAPGNHRLAQTLTSTAAGNNCPAGGSDPRCSTSVPIASLRIAGSSDLSVAKPTDVVHYTNTFTNTGQVPYVGISVTIDVLDAGDDANYNGDAAVTAGSLEITRGARIVWTGDIPVGATVTQTASLTVKNPPTGNKLLSATLISDTPGSNCPTGSSDPTCRIDVSVLTPGLTISKTADTATTIPGAIVNYTVTVHNTGETTYTGAVVEDYLGGILRGPDDADYTGTPTATSGTVMFLDPGLRWSGDLALDQTVLIRYSVVVDEPALGDRSIVNIVSSDELGSSCPTGSSNPACKKTVTVLVPQLDTAIAADTTTTTPGSVVGYTLTIRNTGQTPYVGAQVNASFADVLDDGTYNNDAASTAGGTFAAAEGVLTWTGNLPVGASTTITYTVTVNQPDTGNKTLTTVVTSPDQGSTCRSDVDCVNTVAVLIPGLAVTSQADVATATPGDRVTYTVTLANTGQTPYVGLAANTALGGVIDDAALEGAPSATLGVVSYAAPNLSWTGTLAVGETAVITYPVVIRSTPDLGDRELTSSVVVDAAGSSCPAVGGAPGCTTTVAVLVPALTIAKSADVATTTPGGKVTYTISLTNTGQTDYAGATVTDSLIGVRSDATYDGNATVTGGGNLSYAGSTLTWTGNLLVGGSATITYSVTVLSPDPGGKLLVNAVTSSAPGSTCPPGNGAAACTTSVTVLVPALTLTKTVDRSSVAAGGAVRYTITATNTGQTPYAPATFTDALTGVLDDADYAGDAVATIGTVAYANGTLSWSGPLELDQTATVTYSVLTRFPAFGDRSLVNAVTSSSAGSTCVTGSEAVCRTAVTVLVPALTISKTADRSAVVGRGMLTYTIAASNTGEADYPDAVLTDSLAGVLDDATLNANATTATRGTITYADGTLSWHGPLAKNEQVLISYTVTVDTTPTGDNSLVNRVVSTSVGSTCPDGGSSPGCRTTTAVNPDYIGLTDLTPSFTLSGAPGTTISTDSAVQMSVDTNSLGGYNVTVRGAAGADLVPRTAGNPDLIPLDQLRVRGSGGSAFTPLSAENPFVVHRQSGPSAPGGDRVTNDYEVTTPFVASDTYSTTLEYIATAE